MGLFDSIERLITEHGSAGILKERLSLAADRHAALERENADLKRRLADSENVIARSGHPPLRLDLNKETRDEL